MNRFFRSALFPLIVIVLLVYLASQTLIPHGKSSRKVTYSELIQDVFVDAKVPRAERASWPLVVRGDEVVSVPGIVETDKVRARRT